MLGLQLIQNLGSKLGLELELDESNSCAFEIDDMYLTISLLEETNEIDLTCDLGSLPEKNAEPLLLKLLEANYQHQETHGSTLSVNNLTGRAALCNLLPADIIDDDSFDEILNQFINTAEFYTKIIKAFPQNGLEESSEIQEDLNNNGFIPV